MRKHYWRFRGDPPYVSFAIACAVGGPAGLKCCPPCLTPPPHRPSSCLLELRPLLRTPERRPSRACKLAVASAARLRPPQSCGCRAFHRQACSPSSSPPSSLVARPSTTRRTPSWPPDPRPSSRASPGPHHPLRPYCASGQAAGVVRPDLSISVDVQVLLPHPRSHDHPRWPLTARAPPAVPGLCAPGRRRRLRASVQPRHLALPLRLARRRRHHR